MIDWILLDLILLYILFYILSFYALLPPPIEAFTGAFVQDFIAVRVGFASAFARNEAESTMQPLVESPIKAKDLSCVASCTLLAKGKDSTKYLVTLPPTKIFPLISLFTPQYFLRNDFNAFINGL